MINYADLHIHTKYTINNGISEIDELIKKAKEYNMKALGIADSASMSGVNEFYTKCIENGIKPIIGCGFYFAEYSINELSNEKYHLVLIAQSKQGYENLIKLYDISYDKGYYKRPRIDFELLEKYNNGLICLSGGLGGLIDKYLLKDEEKASIYIDQFVKIFGKDRFFLELQDNELEKNKIMMEKLVNIAKLKNLNLVVSGGSFYIKREDSEKCNILRKENGNKELEGSGYYFKSPKEIYERFSKYPEAIENTIKIADKCQLY